ncbi:hypothetical protein LVW35_18920 [Pseudomonas sp. HN11]|uniref:hypothetical protein n=1 Tax=Pseudomonas sp. HN11 TaxID=1344094 RepID=UPI001F3A049A|nr:hypothetical protein [Pseudomonas sp. HN11]UII69741.1 hypothetical protein LVW35_18920 [Pseudomonas sp. HN11]
MDFATTLWEWYGEGEYKRVLAVCEAFPALEFLAMSADAQQKTIPDCPACEAWSMTMLPLSDTLVACGNAMPSELRRGLESLWKLCNGLSEDPICLTADDKRQIEPAIEKHGARAFGKNPQLFQSPTKFIGSQQQFFLLDTSRPQAAKLPPLTLDLPGQQ